MIVNELLDIKFPVLPIAFDFKSFGFKNSDEYYTAWWKIHKKDWIKDDHISGYYLFMDGEWYRLNEQL